MEVEEENPPPIFSQTLETFDNYIAVYTQCILEMTQMLSIQQLENHMMHSVTHLILRRSYCAFLVKRRKLLISHFVCI